MTGFHLIPSSYNLHTRLVNFHVIYLFPSVNSVSFCCWLLKLTVDVSRLCLQSHQPTEEVVHRFCYRQIVNKREFPLNCTLLLAGVTEKSFNDNVDAGEGLQQVEPLVQL